jgi:hypothetical protein
MTSAPRASPMLPSARSTSAASSGGTFGPGDASLTSAATVPPPSPALVVRPSSAAACMRTRR